MTTDDEYWGTVYPNNKPIGGDVPPAPAQPQGALEQAMVFDVCPECNGTYRYAAAPAAQPEGAATAAADEARPVAFADRKQLSELKNANGMSVWCDGPSMYEVGTLDHKQVPGNLVALYLADAWVPVSERLPGALEVCDWLAPISETKRERWILCRESGATASVPGRFTHWRSAQPLPPAAPAAQPATAQPQGATVHLGRGPSGEVIEVDPPAPAVQAEPVARLLHWTGPNPVPHDGIAARTFVEFHKGAGEGEGYWREGAPLYTAPPARDPAWVEEAMRLHRLCEDAYLTYSKDNLHDSLKRYTKAVTALRKHLES